MTQMENTIQGTKLVIKQLILNLKTIIRNPYNIFLLFLLPTLWLSLPMFIVPLKYSFGLIVLFISFSMSMMVYSFITANYRNSTLYMNSQLTKGNKWTFNLATLLAMGIIIYILFFYVVILTGILSNAGMLISDWSTSSSIYFYYVKYLNWGYIIYQIFTCILVAYAFSYFMNRFSDSQKMFYITIISLSVLMVIFGGVFNQYFGLPYPSDELELVYHRFPSNSLFPEQMFIPSLFFPFFSQGQMLVAMSQKITFNVDGTTAWSTYGTDYFTPWIWETKNGMNDFTNIGIIQNWAGWRWNILWFMPYIHVAIWFGLGFVVSTVKKK